jgi:RHS repeat-associated protein
MALIRVPSSPRSRLGNPFAHQGLALDAEIASYQNRARQYNPVLKRFMQRDPLGLEPSWVHHLDGGLRIVRPASPVRQYHDGLNLHAYALSIPLAKRDPQGTTVVDLQNCSIISGFPGASSNPCSWTDPSGDPLTHDDFKNSPCFAGDWPGTSDILHCKNKGHGATCRCYRQITWFGNDSFHVCFHDDDGDGIYDCFDGHQDDIGCCIGKGLFGECIWDLCACLWHIIVES